jgi:hypothetical protein
MALIPGSVFYVDLGDIEGFLMVSKGIELKTLYISFCIGLTSDDNCYEVIVGNTINRLKPSGLTYIGRL